MGTQQKWQEQITFKDLLWQYKQEMLQHSYSQSTINEHMRILKMIYSESDLFEDTDL